MTSPSVKATKALEKSPAAKPLRSRWLPDDDPKPRVNGSRKKVPRQFYKVNGSLIILSRDTLYF